jgi:NAD dependent epimerase/dehydratase family enzyme
MHSEEEPDMKIVIPGGLGQVGTVLARAFHADGHEVAVLSRRPHPAPWRVVLWDGATPGDWESELEGAGAVINLAGRSVNCRYSARRRAEILGSRVDSVRAVGRAIGRASRPPAVWLQASTATIYSHRYDAGNDETTGQIGGVEPTAPSAWRFSIEVARAWEAELDEAAPHPLPNRHFMAALRRAWGMPFGLPAKGWMIEAGALLLRTESELILKSRRVVPGRLLADGFSFLYPD